MGASASIAIREEYASEWIQLSDDRKIEAEKHFKQVHSDGCDDEKAHLSLNFLSAQTTSNPQPY